MTVGAQSLDFNHSCALVTGASSGLGVEYARQLAPTCQSLVLVARRFEPMRELAEELVANYPQLNVRCVTVDLCDPHQRDLLFIQLKEMGLVPDLLVNNAGMGDYGAFSGSDWSKIDAMLQLNMTALTHLCHGLLPAMIARRQGAIINISSLASALPIPDFAVYAASKAYVTSFSEALRMELREFAIPVLAVCPGPVHTGFGQVAMRQEGACGLPSREGFYTSTEQVVGESLSALRADRARVYPGWKVALLAAGISLLPIAVIRSLQLSRRESSS